MSISTTHSPSGITFRRPPDHSPSLSLLCPRKTVRCAPTFMLISHTAIHIRSRLSKSSKFKKLCTRVILILSMQQYQFGSRHKCPVCHWRNCDYDQLRVRVVYVILVRVSRCLALRLTNLFSRSGSVSNPTGSSTTGSTSLPLGSVTSSSSSSSSSSSASASSFNGNGNGALGNHIDSGKVGSIAVAVVGIVAGAVFV